ncbi:MAG: ribosomal protein L11 methyltransferase [Bacteroidetes bacterium 4484_276]|nr:MAG: ribosomal protein L11 methyltransferase [Bacteroidetes bacterium 4484_276]
MNYTEIKITLADPSGQATRDTVIAILSQHPFESFAETANSVAAYIPQNLYNENQILETLNEISKNIPMSWEINLIAEQNWNKTWEENYPAVTIAGKCHIRAPFHPTDPNTQFEIIIEPKMSFGTAHHETTSMMIELLMEENVAGKDVLDMGCGTGVLAILASKMGAKKVVAIDNDKWAYENSLENVARNNCTNIAVTIGDDKAIGDDKYNLILANINRNILLEQIGNYANALNAGGKIYLSGFYEKDIPLLLQKAETYNLALLKKLTKNSWAAIILG